MPIRLAAALVAALWFALWKRGTGRPSAESVGRRLGSAARATAQAWAAGSRDRESLAEARSVLGVAEGASAAEIEAAFRRLMLRAHPDQGGSEGLARTLSAARERLIKKS